MSRINDALCFQISINSDGQVRIPVYSGGVGELGRHLAGVYAGEALFGRSDFVVYFPEGLLHALFEREVGVYFLVFLLFGELFAAEFHHFGVDIPDHSIPLGFNQLLLFENPFDLLFLGLKHKPALLQVFSQISDFLFHHSVGLL